MNSPRHLSIPLLIYSSMGKLKARAPYQRAAPIWLLPTWDARVKMQDQMTGLTGV